MPVHMHTALRHTVSDGVVVCAFHSSLSSYRCRCGCVPCMHQQLVLQLVLQPMLQLVLQLVLQQQCPP